MDQLLVKGCQPSENILLVMPKLIKHHKARKVLLENLYKLIFINILWYHE